MSLVSIVNLLASAAILILAFASDPQDCQATATTVATTTTTTSTTTTTTSTTDRPLSAKHLCTTIGDQLDLYDLGLVTLTDKLVQESDAKFDLVCPLEEILQPKEPYTIGKWTEAQEAAIHEIKARSRVKWRKNSQPFWRDNGNFIQNLDNYTIVLYTIGESDAAEYACYIDYSQVPDKLLEDFDINCGAKYKLLVDSKSYSSLDLKPVISYPPANFVSARGENVTFTCSSNISLLSHPTTTWYKSCAFPRESECAKKFLDDFEDAQSRGELYHLKDYQIVGAHQDTLAVNNITENKTGYYVCAVHNLRGSDIRLGWVELIDFLYKAQAEKGNVISILPSSAHQNSSDWQWMLLGFFAFTIVALGLIGCVYIFKISILNDKKQNNSLLSSKLEDGLGSKMSDNLRQRLPKIDYPDIYNIGKTADGFISGHLHQDTGHLLSQSICSNILNKEKNLSISSSNSQHSDEASSSWGKSMSSNGDNCRAFYLHTSNTTATTVPMYDHPSSTGTLLRPCGTLVQDACIINPTYGFLRPENDATEWAFPRRNLDRLNKIGEGQFGEVWRYIARQKDGGGEIVAVKQLRNRAGLGDRERLELIAEIEIMKSVNDHPNVIRLLHYCVDEYEPILLIMEYAENGKLQTYLRNCRRSRKLHGCLHADPSPQVTSKDLIKFTYHIAKGMEYVASKGIVHRDLASRNILVSKEKVCKVADFGFARRVNDDCAYERTTTNPVPVKWMAPEALVENKFTSKSDVFSLGILMWEIVTLGATPYEQLTSEGVYRKVTTGGRLERPSHCRDEFYSLMAQCWRHDPTTRPTFKEVACQLEKLLLSENDYIELDQYPEHAYYNVINSEDKGKL